MRHAGGWLALAALTVFPFSADNFELPHQLVLVLGAVVLSYRPREVPRTAALLLALLAIAALLTTLTSVSPALSTPGLISLLVVTSFALTSLPLPEGERVGVRADTFSWTPVLWTTWPIAAWAFAQRLGLDPVNWNDAARWCGGLRPFSTLGHPTQLGVWMALVCVLAVDDAVERRSKPMALTALLAAVTCGVTLSRAGWLALAVGLLCWWWPRRALRLPRSALALAAAGLAAVLLLVKGPAVLERLTNFFVAPTRVQLWTTALAGFREHPWLGWGYDTFALVDQQLRHPDAWRYEWGGTAGHAHSVLPQTLATQGVLGLAVLLLCVALVVRAWRADPQRPHAEVAVVLALAAASMVAFSGVAVAALGLVALVRSLRAGPKRALPAWLPLPMLGLAAVTVMVLGASVSARLAPQESFARKLEPWNAQWPALQGEALERAGQLPGARLAYERAQALAPLAVFEANVGRVAAKQGDAEAARSAFERARRHAPLDGRIALDAAEASVRLGDVDLAEATLTSLVALYPSDGPAWLLLGRLRLQRGRVTEARAAFEVALGADWRDWPEGLGLARALLSGLLTQTGDPQLAAQVAQGPQTFALPGEACGAPSLLRR